MEGLIDLQHESSTCGNPSCATLAHNGNPSKSLPISVPDTMNSYRACVCPGKGDRKKALAWISVLGNDPYSLKRRTGNTRRNPEGLAEIQSPGIRSGNSTREGGGSSFTFHPTWWESCGRALTPLSTRWEWKAAGFCEISCVDLKCKKAAARPGQSPSGCSLSSFPLLKQLGNG